MGFFSRLLGSSGARRRRSGGSAGRTAATGKAGKARRRRRNGENAVYSVERSVTTTQLSGGSVPLAGRKKTKTTREYRHGKCPVKHRSRQAAARCTNP